MRKRTRYRACTSLTKRSWVLAKLFLETKAHGIFGWLSQKFCASLCPSTPQIVILFRANRHSASTQINIWERTKNTYNQHIYYLSCKSTRRTTSHQERLSKACQEFCCKSHNGPNESFKSVWESCPERFAKSPSIFQCVLQEYFANCMIWHQMVKSRFCGYLMIYCIRTGFPIISQQFPGGTWRSLGYVWKQQWCDSGTSTGKSAHPVI